MTNYYEQIRQACIKVNPSILDLKMGCEVKTWFSTWWWSSLYVFNEGVFPFIMKKEFGIQIMWPDGIEFREEGNFEILWRPLHLEDILMVLGGVVFYNWNIYPDWRDFEDWSPSIPYDLSKSLQDQSPETLKWICEQITK